MPSHCRYRTVLAHEPAHDTITINLRQLSQRKVGGSKCDQLPLATLIEHHVQALAPIVCHLLCPKIIQYYHVRLDAHLNRIERVSSHRITTFVYKRRHCPVDVATEWPLALDRIEYSRQHPGLTGPWRANKKHRVPVTFEHPGQVPPRLTVA